MTKEETKALLDQLQAAKERELAADLPVRRHDQLTDEELYRHFTEEQSVLMNFVPRMLDALCCDLLLRVVNLCRDERIECYKKATRELKPLLEKYATETALSYGDGAQCYLEICTEFFKEIQTHLMLMTLGFYRAAQDQLAGHPQPRVASLLAQAICVWREARKIRSEWAAKVGEAIGEYVSYSGAESKHLNVAYAVSKRMTADWSQELKDQYDIMLWPKVIANTAHKLAMRLLEEEKENERIGNV